MDEYDRVGRSRRGVDPISSFTPKFDIKETKEAYELHGEFPGIEQKNIGIEWTDGNTLTISGHTEHHHEEGHPQGFIEGEANGDKKKAHQPTVEDEGDSKAVSKKGTQDVAKQPDQNVKYWVSERSYGEFHRSFSFPTRIDQEKVKASLKNGILHIVVPKAPSYKARKINIDSE